MKQYLDLLTTIIEKGTPKGDRTGTGTISLFGHQMRFDLTEGFPLVTTKKVPFRLIVEELLWMLRGETNVRSLQEKKVHIWDEWADESGDLGPVYGKMWREFPPAAGYVDYRTESDGDIEFFGESDQIQAVIDRLKTNPECRRNIVTAWHPGLHRPESKVFCGLPPCHCFFQFWSDGKRLSCQMYQRSADVFLGVPFNIASYALLTHIIAHLTGLEAWEFVHTFGDVHIYQNHIHQVALQVTREPKPLPTLEMDPDFRSIEELTYDSFNLVGYDPHPTIKAPVAV